ncbi:hypothetical protein EV368DRAFT_89704 [Lentinula lateritia]|nr:hypothetical protein EV368DRAFT_89704 [Lentinula lateritia]
MKYLWQISAPESMFHLDLLRLDFNGFSVYDIHESLVQAFGSVHDSAKLHPVLLDSMDTTRREYKKIYNLFAGLCQAITDRLVFNFAVHTSCPPTALGPTNTSTKPAHSTFTSASASSSSTAEPAPSASSSLTAEPASSATIPTYSAYVKAAQTFAKPVFGFTWANFL